jgi:riboflavin synthase
MFTGLIEEVGLLEAVTPAAAGSRLRIRAAEVASGLKDGDSISVNGVCLTAVGSSGAGFEADASPETIERSTLARLRAGTRLNLERALAAGGRLGGHIVQGHVDGIGSVVKVERAGGEHWRLRVRVPAELGRYLVYKGSVAVDGISLTVAEAAGDEIEMAIIPHTWTRTNLCDRRAGDAVNIETDVLAKYVERMLGTLDVKRGITTERLAEEGY